MESRAGNAAVERSPETARCMRPDIEIIVEWQFGGVGYANDRRLSQPEPVFNLANVQQNMPAIRRLPAFTR
jgi:hypothetical protein